MYLSQDQLALYRVMTRDAHLFSELGRRYHASTTGIRDAKFAGYLVCGQSASAGACATHTLQPRCLLLRRGSLGLRQPSDAEIAG